MDYAGTEGGIPPLVSQILTTTGGALLLCIIFHYAWYVLGGLAFALGLTVAEGNFNGGDSDRPKAEWRSLKYLSVVLGGSFFTWLVNNHPWYALTDAISAATTSWWDFTLVYAAELPSLFLSFDVGSRFSQWLVLSYAWSGYLLFGLAVAVLVARRSVEKVDLSMRAMIMGGAAGLMWLFLHYSLSRYFLFGMAFTATVVWNNKKGVDLTTKSMITGLAAGTSWLLLHFSLGWYFFLGFCLAVAIRAVTETPLQAFWFIAGGGGAATLWLLVNDTWFFTVGLVIAVASALMAGFDEKDFPLHTFWVFTGIGSTTTWLFFNYLASVSTGILWTIFEVARYYLFGAWTLYIILIILTSLSAINNLKMNAVAATVYGGGVSIVVYILINFSWARYALIGILAAAYTGGAIHDTSKFPVSLFILTAVGAGGIPWLMINNHVSVIVAILLTFTVCIIIALHSMKKHQQGLNSQTLGMTGLLVFLIVFHGASCGSSLTTSSGSEEAGELINTGKPICTDEAQMSASFSNDLVNSNNIAENHVTMTTNIHVGDKPSIHNTFDTVNPSGTMGHGTGDPSSKFAQPALENEVSQSVVKKVLGAPSDPPLTAGNKESSMIQLLHLAATLSIQESG